MDKVPSSAFDDIPTPEYPDHQRDPRDRRKHLRCGHLRYVSNPELKNSTKALASELKLVNEGVSVGMDLTRIFTVLFGHLDQPMEDHISGVSPFYDMFMNSFNRCLRLKHKLIYFLARESISI